LIGVQNKKGGEIAALSLSFRVATRVGSMFHQLRGSLVRSGLPTTQQQLVNERIALFAQMNTGRSHKMPMT